MNKSHGFTIVELLVVIVVIGILATVVIINYTGISEKANIASLKSDLSASAKLLGLFHTEKGLYPSSNNCTATTSSQICLKASSGNEFIYSSELPYTTYTLIARKINSGKPYYVEPGTSPQEYSPVTGGIVTDSLGYRTHTLNTNGTLLVKMDILAEVSVSAGGGGGGGGSCGSPYGGNGTSGNNSSVVYNSTSYLTYGGSGGSGAGDYNDGGSGSNGGTSNPAGWTSTNAGNAGNGGNGGEGMGGSGGSGGKLSKVNFNLVKSQNMTITTGSGGLGGSGTGGCGWATGSSGEAGGNGVVTVKYLF